MEDCRFMTVGWPLVGRDRELQQLERLLADPDAAGVVLAGPAGVGKSHLVEQLVERLSRPSTLVVRATRSASSVPLGAFAPFLPDDLGGGEEGIRLWKAALALAAGADDEGRRVVCIDDAHLLDQASSALVSQLAVDSRVFLVVTMRSAGDAVDGSEDRFVDLWKDRLTRIDLRTFDEVTTASVLEAVLGGQAEETSARRIYETSGGNALYLHEVVSGLLASGGLVEESGLWRVVGHVTSGVELAQLFEHRLADLDHDERRVLELVVLGEPLGLVVLEERGWGPLQEGLERRRLVVTELSERRWQVRPAHPLIGEVVRQQLTRDRRLEVVRLLADTVAATGMRRRDDKRRVALWMLEVGEAADPDVLLDAARDAMSGADLDAVVVLATAALEGGSGAPGAHVLGRALDGLGRNDEAEALLAHAEGETSDVEQRTILSLARADNLFRGLGRPDASEAVLVEAEAVVEDIRLRARIVAQRAVQATLEGRIPAALAMTEPLLTENDPAAFCEVALAASGAMRNGGRLEEAIRLMDEALQIRRGLSQEIQAPAPAILLSSRAMTMIEFGRIDEAVESLRRGYDTMVRMNFAGGIAWLAMVLAMGELTAGRLESAKRYARQCAVAFRTIRHPGARWGYELLAHAAAQRGDVKVAEQALADFDDEPPTHFGVSDPDARRARAWLAAAKGDLDAARRIALEASDRARDSGIPCYELQTLFDYARFGEVAPIVERISMVAAGIEGPLAQARAGYVCALHERDASGLDAMSVAFQECDATILAAEAAREAAIIHAELGDQRAAAAAANRSTTLTAVCEGARTPSLAAPTTPAGLTDREIEIARLAARGKSNREIAASLFLSIRTVENHLQRIYGKLGIRNRSELPPAPDEATA